VTIARSTFTNNQATGRLSTSLQAAGGALHSRSCSVSLSETTFQGNVAATQGGALMADSAIVTVTSSLFRYILSFLSI
jgi:predicted outer membrane repeat protein